MYFKNSQIKLKLIILNIKRSDKKQKKKRTLFISEED